MFTCIYFMICKILPGNVITATMSSI